MSARPGFANRPCGWDRALVAVLDGARPDGVLTLAAISGREGFAAALRGVAGLEPRPRAAAMTVLHVAVTAVGAALIAPLAVDGVALDIDAGALGVVRGPAGAIDAVWVGRHGRPELIRPAVHAGTVARRLLGGVVAQVCETTGLPTRGVARVTAQAIESRCRRYSGAPPAGPAPAWFDELRLAAGLPTVTWRRLVVRPDAGPEVVVNAPSTCCVLSPSAQESSCPGCPQHPAAEQEDILAGYLATLDDREFREAAGRPRVRAA